MFAEPTGRLRVGMSRQDVLDLMRYPPGRYGRPFQSFRRRPGHVATPPGPIGPPSYSFHRWEGSDVCVVVGYDEHGRVNRVTVHPVP